MTYKKGKIYKSRFITGRDFPGYEYRDYDGVIPKPWNKLDSEWKISEFAQWAPNKEAAKKGEIYTVRFLSNGIEGDPILVLIINVPEKHQNKAE